MRKFSPIKFVTEHKLVRLQSRNRLREFLDAVPSQKNAPALEVRMKLYDASIAEINELLDDMNFKSLKVCKDGKQWNEEANQHLIMKKDMAYELGGGIKSAVSGLAFTSTGTEDDSIILCGPDLQDINEDVSYARITILNVDDSEWNDNDKAYASMRKIDYTRYHIFPEGYMMRISTSAEREPVRVGKKALQEGLNFEKVGNIFINAYHRHREVRGVKMIFITEKAFNYDELGRKVEKLEKITESLNKIFSNLKMDCGSCGLKAVCDEVEGMKELHFSKG